MTMKIQRKDLLNYFVEGLQGAGKSTMVKLLSDELPEYELFREGDYSPVELAWCAYVAENQYRNILAKYPALENEISGKTIVEGDYRIICYTQILTDVVGFHKDLEQYEIYNGNELWFPLMIRYIEESPYAEEHSLHGMEGLLTHLERRKALEHRIINEIFKEETIVVKSKNYNLRQLFPTGKGK